MVSCCFVYISEHTSRQNDLCLVRLLQFRLLSFRLLNVLVVFAVVTHTLLKFNVQFNVL